MKRVHHNPRNNYFEFVSCVELVPIVVGRSVGGGEMSPFMMEASGYAIVWPARMIGASERFFFAATTCYLCTHAVRRPILDAMTSYNVQSL